MIGQDNIKSTIISQLESNTLPHFIILVGGSGSGRKTLIKEVFGNTGYWLNGVSVEKVREMIDGAYHYHDTVFVIPDADNMSSQAKNALLKVVEECPNNNRFIMTLESESNTLDPIRSRASIYRMDMYTPDEIEEFVRGQNLAETEDAIKIYRSVCVTMGDALLLSEYGAEEFYAYVEKVVDNIIEVSGANAFKIADKISLKDGDDKYDLRLFFKTFINVCIHKFLHTSNVDMLMYAEWCQTTSNYLAELRITGINKQLLFDAWLLDIRSVGM